jgi:molybdopterin/thiamine biosynthesis adenylyltransferase
LSPAPTSRSPDLRRLRDEGYSISLIAGLLVVDDIPFADTTRNVALGRLIVTLDMLGDCTAAPTRHDAFWSGGAPCDQHGQPLSNLITAPLSHDLGNGLICDHHLCNRPAGREFVDYHELVSAYVALISGHAAALDPSKTARTRRRIVEAENPNVAFNYVDTATSRAGLGSFSSKLEGGSVGIIGLGGTGSYVLDLVAKTPVERIHLFDGDVFLQHNAFRAPGAASVSEIGARRAKVDHFAAIYSRMHRGIVPHRLRLGGANLRLLDNLDFAFLCLDDSVAKRPIMRRLERNGTPFIDCGLGLELTETGILGSVRVTTSTERMRSHVRDGHRIPFAAGGEPDAYASNVQVADLNALNAALAVIRWKRLRGFYATGASEHHCLFSIDGNQLLNADESDVAPARDTALIA